MSDERDAKIWLAKRGTDLVMDYLHNFGVMLPVYDRCYINRHIKGALIAHLPRKSLKLIEKAIKEETETCSCLPTSSTTISKL